MKNLLILISLLVATTGYPKPMKVLESTDIPPQGFSTFEDLSKWASTSSFGGGHAKEIKLNEAMIFYSDRMFTSGRPTSELTFYSKRKDGSIHPFIHIPLQWKEFRIELKEAVIVIHAKSLGSDIWNLAAVITESMIPNQ